MSFAKYTTGTVDNPIEWVRRIDYDEVLAVIRREHAERIADAGVFDSCICVYCSALDTAAEAKP